MPTRNPINVILPNNKHISSSHTTTLNIPGLSDNAKNAHVLPELKSSSLLSIGQLCDDNCIAIFSKSKLHVAKKQKIILQGTRDPINGMWNVPLPLQDNPSPTISNSITNRSIPPTTDMVNYLGESNLLGDCINFLYAACFSPAKSTFIQAVEAGFLTTWPNLTPYNVKKYLLKSMPSAKGYLDQQYMYTRSTTRKRKTNLPTTLADKDQIVPIE